VTTAQVLALFSDSAKNCDPHRALLAAGFNVLACHKRSELVEAYRRGSCTVLQTDVLRLGSVSATLARELPGGESPVVMVIGRTSENMRALASLNTSAVVYYDEVESSLVPTVERIQSASYLREVEARLRAARDISPQLRTALCYACRSPDPIISVTSLAARVCCDRSTLYRGWRRVWGDGEVTLDQFLDWVLLLRAIPRKRAGQTWGSLARGLSVSERTLSRTVRRILDQGLRDIDGNVFDGVRSNFEKRVLERLVGEIPREGAECDRMSEYATERRKRLVDPFTIVA
jgi:hypothetical protein